MANFILDLPDYFLASAFTFKAGVVRHMTHLLLNLALHFVDLATTSFSVLSLILLPPLQ